MSVVNPVCNDDCSTNMPKVNFTKCNPETHTAQIQRIFLGTPGNPLSNWTSASVWAARLQNTPTAPTDIITLHVIGSKPAPEKQKVKISLGREVVGKKKHKILIKIDETNSDNYEMLRQNECGQQYSLWYETTGGMLYGGNDGILASMDLDDIIVEDSGQMETFDGELTWEGQFHPERTASPIAL